MTRWGDGLTVLTPEQQVAAILARDTRRVRRLTWLVAGLWALTTLATGLMTASVNTYLHEPKPSRGRLDDGRELGWSERRTEILFNNHKAAISVLATELLVVVILVSASAAGTLYLIHAGRRATTRQIQAGLADISNQLATIVEQAANVPQRSEAG